MACGGSAAVAVDSPAIRLHGRAHRHELDQPRAQLDDVGLDAHHLVGAQLRGLALDALEHVLAGVVHQVVRSLISPLTKPLNIALRPPSAPSEYTEVDISSFSGAKPRR